MVFNSIEFFIFLPVVLGLYWLLRRRLGAQNLLLLAASYLFYGWWDARFLGLIALSTLVDFVIARRMDRTDVESQRRWLMALSLIVNLGILGFFKYFNFFVETAASALRSIGLEPATPMLSIVLPVGISFYTFQTISYTFDVFRRRVPHEKNLLTFGVYVAFFPQLVAGPIERAQRLLPQIQRRRSAPDATDLWTAGTLILTGLFKKIVLADGLAAVVEARFSSPDTHGSLSLLLGVYAFAIQIYGDFSGYSSIARGVSRLFGIELMRNFEQPYLSTNITQFWRTWHISLSTWLADYLYVPLGGNRGGRWKTYRNLMLTMLLGGLWHGAAWTFVIWGAAHGLMLAIHRATGAHEPRGRPGRPRGRDLWRVFGTFHLVALAWVFFRADSLGLAGKYFSGLLRFTDGAADGNLGLLATAVLVGAFMFASFSMDWVDRSRATIRPLQRWGAIRIGIAFGLMVVAILVWSGGTPEPFIYFQF